MLAIPACPGLWLPPRPAIIRPKAWWERLWQRPQPLPMLATRMRQAAAVVGGLQFVGGNVGSHASADVTVSLTALTGGLGATALEGDIVVVVATNGGSSDLNMVVNTAGYTELADLYANDDADTNFLVAYKIMGVTPDTSVVVDNPAGTSLAVAVHVWRGVDQSTPIDATTTTATGINSGLANPPSITPVTAGAVILACGGCADVNGGSLSHTLDNLVEESIGAISRAAAIASFGEWASGAYNPAAFTLSGADSTSNSWAAATVALRPA